MKEAKKFNKRERGVTLISLVVMIVLLVMLAVVAVSQIAGDGGLINTSQTASEETKITQYGEQVDELFQGTVLANWTLGEDITINQIAEEMEKEAWIKTAEIVDDGQNNKILATVTDGYQYLEYYDPNTGEMFSKYIGKYDEKKKAVKVVAGYDSDENSIDTTAKCDDGIVKIELIYKDQIVATVEWSNEDAPTTATYEFLLDEIKNTYPNIGDGLYEVKATSKEGIIGYDFVWVYSKQVGTPKIYVSSASTSINDWYGADGTDLEVTIEAENATSIYYKLNDGGYTSASGDKVTITITTQGITKIYAYAEMGSTQSASATPLTVKYDNVVPTVTASDITITGDTGDNGWYTSEVEISLADAITDATSGVRGYYYYIGTDESSKKEVLLDQTITVSTEGETRIVIQGVDVAGNVTGETYIEVDKDTVAPKDFTPSISNAKSTSLTINAYTTDDTSGINRYEFYVGGEYKGSSTTGELTVDGLTAETEYDIYVIAYDNAGNMATSSTEKGTTGVLTAPTIKVEGTEGNNGWYTSDVKVTITASSDATKITYSVNGTETTVSGAETSFTITNDGTNTITAYSEDDNNHKSAETTQVVKIDTTAPTAPTITPSGTLGTNSWYVSNVVATITAGTDATSGVSGVEYESTGAKELANTSVDQTEVKVTVTEDGTTVITAVTVDNAGNKSAETTQEVKKDAVNPIAGLTVGSYGTNSISVTADGTDITSGVYSYEFQYSTDGKTYDTAETKQTSDSSCDYTYSNLKSNTTYYLRVVVTDNAGNTATSTATTQDTNKVTAPTIRVEEGTEGNNGWYTTEVKVIITADIDASKIKYVVTGDNPIAETEVDGTTVTFTITEDGTSTITAYAIDSEGNQSDSTTLEVKKDATKPEAPTLTPSGTEGNNGWYISDVDVAITAGSDATSGVSGVTYSADGSNEIAITTENKTSTSVTITEDGTTTITAVTEDNAGNTSDSTTLVIKKDETNPTAELEVTDYGTNSIVVTGKGTDETSGVYSYEFQYSTTSATLGFVTAETKETSDSSCSYTYLNLNSNTTYYLRVIVTDNAGNSAISAVEKQDTDGIAAPTITIEEGTEGNNGWYTTDVKVKITAGSDASKIKYEVTGANAISEVEVDGTTVTFTITIDGESTISAYALDGAGNASEEATLEVKKDATKPTAPTIEVTTGDLGNNNWYISDVVATITAGTDATSGVSGLTYSADGASAKAETTESVTTTTVDVTDDGTTTITAVTVDNAGNTSEETTLVIKKDATAPEAPTLTPSGTEGANSWYITDVDVTITAGADATSGASGLTYSGTGSNTISETTVALTTTSVTITTDGTTKVTAVTIDAAGNTSAATELEIKKDTVEPTAPTIVVTDGDLGNNNWYTTNVTATITAGTDATSGVSGITYSATGATTVAETTENVTTTTVDVTEDGTTTITAVTVDNAGLTSTETTKVIYRDVTDPTASIEIDTVGENSIEVTGKGTDEASGVYSYEFQYSTNGTTYDTAEIIISSANTYDYTYTNLDAETDYWLRVIVTDKAGNEATSSAEKETTLEASLLSAPKITLSGDIGTNSWYTSDIEVTITDPATKSLATTLVYTVNGTSTTLTGQTSTTFTIDTDGEYTITAYFLDSSSNESTKTTVEPKRDATDPTASISLTSYNDIEILTSGTGTDATSGVYSIDFQLSTTSATSGFTSAGIYTVDTQGETSSTKSHTYSSLTAGTTYYLRVVVTDYAGNTATIPTSDVITQATEGALGTPVLTVDGTEGENDWYTSEVEVTITAENATRIYYKESSTDTDYKYTDGDTATFTISTEGTTTIGASDYYAVNTRGAIEYGDEDATIKIDLTNPVINLANIVITGTKGNNGWYVSTVYLTLTNAISDTVSGVAGYYQANGSEPLTTGNATDVSVQIEATDGKNEYYIVAKDNAGRTSSTTVVAVNVDTVAPNAPTLTPSGTEGTNSWYISDVEVKITAGSDATSGASQIEYVATGSNPLSETTVSGTSTSITIEEDGTTTITAYTIDAAGNRSTTGTTLIVYKDATAPTAPTIVVTDGTEGTNDWYRSDVVATITAGTDATSGVYGLTYSASGATTKAETTENVTTTTVTVTEDGTTTITAVTVDKAGNESAETTLAIKKDETNPTASLEIGTVGENTITVTGKGTDATSGVYSYEFQYSTTSATSGFITAATKTSSDSTCEYEYEGLDAETDYWLRVIVTDNAGNSATSTAEKETTLEESLLLAPKITLSGDIGTNDWYTSDIEVTITDPAEKTLATTLVYTVNGTSTTVNGTSTSFTISTDGTYTIKAYFLDSEENESSTTTKTAKRDATAPTAEISLTSYNDIQIVTAGTGTDATSGVYTIDFQLSTTSTTSGFSSISTYTETSSGVTTSTESYTYSGLTAGTTYYLRVVVTDYAGNTATVPTSDVITQTTEGALGTPKLTLSGTEGDNDWYISEVEVTITAENAKGIYYKESSTDTSYKYADGDTVTFTISTEGTTTIGASDYYAVNTRGAEAWGTESATINIDLTDPVIDTSKIVITGTEGNNGWYTSSVILSLSNAITDSVSGVAGYYKATGSEPSTSGTAFDLTTKSAVTKDGTNIVYIIAKDNAGRTSEASTIEITKDATAPTAPTIVVTTGTLGNNNWYTTDVIATITAGSDATSGVYGITYSADGATTKAETTESVTTTTVTVSDDGTTTITAVTVDNAGLTSAETTLVIKRDATAPEAPTLTPSGTVGNNDWYTTNVAVAIVAGSDATSGASQIEYVATGSNTIADTTEDATETSVTISTDGTTTITAYTIDAAGNRSTGTLLEIKKDATAPTINSFAVTSYDETSITVKVTATDATSGIYRYIFYIKASSGTTYTGVSKISDSGEYTYTYPDLTADTEYSFYVRVYDYAGKTQVSSTLTQSTEEAGELLAPTIKLDGDVGTNDWYTSDIKVTITDPATKSLATTLVYSVNGTSTTVNGTSTTFTISTDGEYTIEAYFKDSSNVESNTTTVEANRDATNPTAELALTSYNDIQIITSGTGTDATSGVYKIDFQYSTTSASSGFTSAGYTTVSTSGTTSKTVSYTYSSLTAGKTYYLRAVVTDYAGNIATSSAVTQATEGALGTPVLTVSGTEGENDWYISTVTVTITAENATRIYYKESSTDTDYSYTDGDTATFTISTQGTTTIGASDYYAVNTRGAEVYGEEAATIKIDLSNPVVNVANITATGTAGNGDWYKSTVYLNVSSAITDSVSGVQGYYTKNGSAPSTSGTATSISTKIEVNTEGKNTIYITAKDNAGRTSTGTIEVDVDTLAPVAFTPSVSNQSTTGFTVTASTTDNTTSTTDVSGMSYYEIYVGGSLVTTISGTTASYDVSGLTPNKDYSVYVIAYDAAGNSTTSTIVTATTTSLSAPTITLSGTEGNSGWYRSNVLVTIVADSNASSIYYEVTGAGATTGTLTGTSGSFYITTDGTSTVQAWSVDSSGNTSDDYAEEEVNKDATAPTSVTLTVSKYTESTIKVAATASDATSGIYSYTYEISTSSSFTSSTTTTTTNYVSTTSDSCDYTSLSKLKSYYLRVTVEDEAGNTKVSNTAGRYCWLVYNTEATTTYSIITSGSSYVSTTKTLNGGSVCEHEPYWNNIFFNSFSATVKYGCTTGAPYVCTSSVGGALCGRCVICGCYGGYNYAVKCWVTICVTSQGCYICGVNSFIKITGSNVYFCQDLDTYYNQALTGTLYKISASGTTYTQGSSTGSYVYSTSSSTYKSGTYAYDSNAGTYYWYVLQ